MTRKDYIAIAADLKYARENAVLGFYEDNSPAEIVEQVAHIISNRTLARDNGRFDRERFLKACGI